MEPRFLLHLAEYLPIFLSIYWHFSWEHYHEHPNCSARLQQKGIIIPLQYTCIHSTHPGFHVWPWYQQHQHS
jgi:hypothetical protein